MRERKGEDTWLSKYLLRGWWYDVDDVEADGAWLLQLAGGGGVYVDTVLPAAEAHLDKDVDDMFREVTDSFTHN